MRSRQLLITATLLVTTATPRRRRSHHVVDAAKAGDHQALSAALARADVNALADGTTACIGPFGPATEAVALLLKAGQRQCR
jgi:hypothetical protein